jgi:hypothetical protein
MNRITVNLVPLILALLFLAVSACASRGSVDTTKSESINGKVLEQGTDKPIAGAIVAVLWTAHLGYTGQICYHVETATTDALGVYYIPAWQRPSPYGDLPSGRLDMMAYKPDYEFLYPQEIHYLAPPSALYVRPFKGTVAERMDYLSRAAVSCSDKKEIERKLLPLFKALYREAEQLAVTKDEKLKSLYRLRDIEELELGTDTAWDNFRQRQGGLR